MKRITTIKSLAAFLIISLLFFQAPILQASDTEPVTDPSGAMVPTVPLGDVNQAPSTSDITVQKQTTTSFLEKETVLSAPEEVKESFGCDPITGLCVDPPAPPVVENRPIIDTSTTGPTETRPIGEPTEAILPGTVDPTVRIYDEATFPDGFVLPADEIIIVRDELNIGGLRIEPSNSTAGGLVISSSQTPELNASGALPLLPMPLSSELATHDVSGSGSIPEGPITPLNFPIPNQNQVGNTMTAVSTTTTITHHQACEEGNGECGNSQDERPTPPVAPVALTQMNPTGAEHMSPVAKERLSYLVNNALSPRDAGSLGSYGNAAPRRSSGYQDPFSEIKQYWERSKKITSKRK